MNASFLSPTDAAAHGISTTMAPGSVPSVPSYLEAPPVHDGDINIYLVGVSATVRHLEGGAFTRDGYGGLEVLVPVESLTTREKSALNDCVGGHVDLRTRILMPRGAPLESTDLEGLLDSVPVRREVASRNEYLERSRRFGRSSRGTSERRRSYWELVTSHWDQRLFQAGIEKEEALQNARGDIRHLMEEHNRDNRGLRKQVKNLSVQLEDAKIHIRLLE
ncbi:Hypothetical protein PHPALM_12449 [Phytophthora palmivora]|uniref:Uncharacterized protein n=1 Tax=Phytophthora palmivora TaxID=4796 RepID=A0A2P4XZR6_9STRA|nr:Hypothetical protein PHPALM_12449 [Phytophthora palmivora]